MKKINKSSARKIYNAGGDVAILPCKANPESIWYKGTIYNNKSGYSFESLCNSIYYYNCNYGMGTRLAYYIAD